MFVQLAPLQQSLCPIPEDEGAIFGVAQFTKLADTNAGVCRSSSSVKLLFSQIGTTFIDKTSCFSVCNQ